MVQKRVELENLHARMNGLIFDVEYGVDAVKSLRNSDEHFNVNTSIKPAFELSSFCLEYCDLFGKIVLY